VTRTAAILRLLRAYESRNVTFLDPAGGWPIVWARAQGVHVWDVEGRKYLDLTAAFGVAAAGHANPAVVRAGQRQMATLLHAMGDVHPHALKARLARELSRLTFERWAQPAVKSASRTPEAGDLPKSLPAGQGAPPLAVARKPGQRAGATLPPEPADVGRRAGPSGAPAGRPRTAGKDWGKTIFCNSGFEAVEAALKTALLATGKPGVLAFAGAYHGLGYGALNVTHRDYFRGPFRPQLRQFARFAPFPAAADAASAAIPPATRSDWPAVTCPEVQERVRRLLRRQPIGAVLVEPIQARGGIHIPPPEFLPLLRRLCDEHGALLILDEIYTGFGRTGKWFACEHSGVVPDLICLGKALTGGFPLSACVGRAEVMDAAWPPSPGEALHTSTFLGHPVGCAMALAHIGEIRRRQLVARSARLGRWLAEWLASQLAHATLALRVRGLGLMAGVELRRADGSPATPEAQRVIQAMLHRGFILLPEGEHGNVLTFTPPLTITAAQLAAAVGALAEELR